MNKSLPTLLLCLVASFAMGQDVSALLEQGIRFHDAGQYDQAIAKYEEAIQLDPRNGTAYYEAAYSYHAKKDYANALKMSEKAMVVGTGRVRLLAIVIHGSVLDDSGEHEKAARFYKDAVKEYPNEYLLWFNYGVTLAGLNQYKEAEEAFVSGLTQNFSHQGSHLQLGNLMLEQNQKAKSAMALYFFLMLENTSARAESASSNLLDLIYGRKTDGKGNTTILLQASGDNSMMSADLFLSMLGATSAELEKKTGATKHQRFVADTQEFFKVLSELGDSGSGKKKKKKKEPLPDIWNTSYVPFYRDLVAAGHAEAFCYHIMKSRKDPEIDLWILNNDDKMEAFYLWVKSR